MSEWNRLNVLDFTQPLETSTGGPVRVLATDVRCGPGLPNCAVVAVLSTNGHENAYYAHETTDTAVDGRGREIKLRNVGEKKQLFLNFYEPDVIEVFASEKEADNNELFSSRDCCIELDLAKTNGTWAVSAKVVKNG